MIIWTEESGATKEVRAGKGAHVEKMTPLPVQPVSVVAEYLVWVVAWKHYVQCLSSNAKQASVSAIEIPVSMQRSRQVPGNVRVSWWAEVITSQSTTVLHCCLYPKPTSVTTAFVCGLPTDVLMASYIRWHPFRHKIQVEPNISLLSNMEITLTSSHRVLKLLLKEIAPI